MRKTNDLHVVGNQPLPSPDELKAELPITARAAEQVWASRHEVRAAIRGLDTRPMVIVGPCSIHDPHAALEYAVRLVALRKRYEHELLIVMRVYFEKPRTTVGWKGLINDPDLDGSCDITAGLRTARKLLLALNELGMPAATELLDPIIPQYIADLISWSAIGARTTESQTHREMASGLSMPVGFKNGTEGTLDIAINAMIAASQPHSFLGVDGAGRVGVVHTSGNADVHAVLRGGLHGPNYSDQHVEAAATLLTRAKVNPRLLIDCSHDNSGKNQQEQPRVLGEIQHQLQGGSPHILGVMIESNLVAGRQSLESLGKHALVYGQSITDACVDFPTTERMLDQLAEAVSLRQQEARAVEQSCTDVA
jgi:3-deoxy-7-phosphoheptulonate synthase